MTPKFYGKIEKGVPLFKPDHTELYAHQIKKLEGQEFELTIRKRGHGRTIPQNKYYWVLITFIAEELGWEDPDELHEAFKLKFLKHTRDGLECVLTTTTLSKTDFQQYIEAIKRWTRIQGIVVPEEEDII